MSKGTTIKEAISRFEEKEGKKASECTVVRLMAQMPPIEKMDASLSTLTCCEQLSLSTNTIEKIANLNGLKHLTILSLGRNNIKSLTGLEAVGETLEQLWISYNNIEKLKGVNVLKKLQILYMSNNQVKEESELVKLADLTCLKEFVFVGNPLQESWPDSLPPYKDYFLAKIPRIKKLDGEPLVEHVGKQVQQQEEE